MIVLVCGGRDYRNSACVFRVLDELHSKRHIDHLIQGGAYGADRIAALWSKASRVTLTTYWADWPSLGKQAGPARNQRMLDEGKPELVVAFPGGRGTADMVRRARAAGVEVMEITD